MTKNMVEIQQKYIAKLYMVKIQTYGQKYVKNSNNMTNLWQTHGKTIIKNTANLQQKYNKNMVKNMAKVWFNSNL